MTVVVRPVRTADEMAAFRGLVVESLFGSPPAPGWHEGFAKKTGAENVFVAHSRSEVVGGYVLFPFGQFFGGRSVPMGGVSAVAVAPHARGKGAAIAMMRHALREARRRGQPLAALYPATQTLYRKAGFELAGSRIHYRVPTRLIGIGDRSLEVRRVGADERAAVQHVYRQRAQATNGNLDRIDWSWGRVFEDAVLPVWGHLILERRRPVGYVVQHHKPPAGGARFYDVHVRDVAALTPGAARRIWALLGDTRSIAENVLVYGSPADPFLQHLPEQDYRVDTRWDWMLRIVDVRAALEARGYATGVTAKVELDVVDDVVRSNHGRFVFEVGGGEARLRRGGAGRVKIDVRGLASLYSGYLSPADLVVTGQISGPEPDLAALAPAFAGPAPWMPDMF